MTRRWPLIGVRCRGRGPGLRRPPGGRLERLLVATVVISVAISVASLGGALWINAKARLAQMLIARAWSQSRDHEHVTPWPWADTWPVAKLTFEDGRQLMVLEGANGRNLAFGPAHDPASVLPGDPGNSVIEGHRDTHFSLLRSVRPGDTLRVERADGRSAQFRVSELRVIDSRHWRIALESGGIARLTLVTCYPFDAVRPGGPLRLVVTADEIGRELISRS